MNFLFYFGIVIVIAGFLLWAWLGDLDRPTEWKEEDWEQDGHHTKQNF